MRPSEGAKRAHPGALKAAVKVVVHLRDHYRSGIRAQDVEAIFTLIYEALLSAGAPDAGAAKGQSSD